MKIIVLVCMCLAFGLALTPAEKLEAIRALMKKENIVAYIIPSEDQHLSEYTPATYKRRAYMSYFTGSVGNAVVTMDKALQWVDSRYYIQAEKQLPKEWTLMKDGMKGVPSMASWLSTNLADGARVGADFDLLRASWGKSLASTLEHSKKELVSINYNLVDVIWTDRPTIPITPLMLVTDEQAGRSVTQKLNDVRSKIISVGAHLLVITALSDVNWLMNIRGKDIDYNPFAYSYAIVGMTNTYFFVDHKRQTAELKKHLPKEVIVMDYEMFHSFLQSYINDHPTERVFYYDDYETYRTFLMIGTGRGYEGMTPTVVLKAIKTEAEIRSMRKNFVYDDLALLTSLAWIHNHIDEGINEYQVGLKTTEFRLNVGHSKGDSFSPIVASGPNAALPHYSAPKENSRVLSRDECILLDTGGQYLFATTDITRTIVVPSSKDLSKVSMEFRKAYTLVLKGHINLLKVVFPENTYAYAIDTLARQYLWEYGMDFNHGTGHGVGVYMGVHEDPLRLAQRHARINVAMQPGMTLTDEPGFYEEVKGYGVRVENTMLIVDAHVNQPAYESKPFYTFESLDNVPYQTDIVLPELLSKEERLFISRYNRNCYSQLKPLIEDPTVMKYLNDLIKQSDKLIEDI